jgi:hypothetical protein
MEKPMRLLSINEISEVSGAGIGVDTDGTIRLGIGSMDGAASFEDGSFLWTEYDPAGGAWAAFDQADGSCQVYAPDGNLFWEN